MRLLDIATVVLFFLSLFGIFSTGNVIKSIVCIMLMQTSVIIFWLGIASLHGTRPPIFVYEELLEYKTEMSDPLPQALMLTAVIIGIAVTAINITMLNTLFRKYKTVDWQALEDLEEE